MSLPYDDLDQRQAALEGLGFTIVERGERQFVAVRMKMHWAWGVRMVALVRVRREAHFTVELGTAGHKELEQLVHAHNPSKVPRGFGVFWSLMDVVLADRADPAALEWAGNKVGKGFAWNAQTAVVTPDAIQPWPKPVWGAAYQPVTHHCFEVATSAVVTPAPTAPLAIAIGLLSFWPGWLVIILSCCGLPLLPLAALVLTEKPPVPAVDASD